MMKMDKVRVGVFLSDCGGLVTETIDYGALEKYVGGLEGVTLIEKRSEFCYGEGLEEVVKAFKEGKIDRAVIAECSPKIAEVRITNKLKEEGINPYLIEIIDLREHCAWPHRRWPDKATEKAKALLLAAIERAKLLEPIETASFPVKRSVLVIGGGVAGINTTIDLSDMGFEVNLVEREPFIGGLAARMVRFFPSDDCAMCVQSPTCGFVVVTNTSRKCLYRSGLSEIQGLRIFTNSKVTAVEGVPGDYKVTIEKKPRYVDEYKCIQCDKCTEVCPVDVPDEFNGNLTNRKAIYLNSPAIYPPIYVIDESACKFGECAKCVDVCPTDAIDLDEKPEVLDLNVGSIIVATGFEEFNPEVIKEYMYGEDPDVITQTELARMLDPFGPTGGMPIKPSSGEKADSIVMIQCVGSRDQRYYRYCSSICCMIALKHSQMIKTVDPDSDITICYIDMRTTGRTHEDYYEKTRESGVKFVKGRPTEILRDPEGDKLTIITEDGLTGEIVNLQADLVVLSAALVPSKGAEELAELLGLELSEDGFFKEYNSKLRPTETKMRGIYICGGTTFPKDVPTTSLHANSAAVKAAKFMMKGEVIKDLKVAVIDENLCGDCEFCPVICPYEAITLTKTADDHVVATISDLKCEGCGLCVGTCPLDAIELRHHTEEQILAQIRALSTRIDSKDPIILAMSCNECGHCTVDSSGMAIMEYPPNVRVMRVPCTGILKVHHFLEAFQAGADAVMVVGCKTDGCHYEVGSVKAAQKVHFARKLLKEYGIEPERLEMFHMVYIEGDQFVDAARMMTERVKSLGSLKEAILI